MIETQIEIAVSPAAVRKILLDFSRYSEWHTGYVKSIKSVDASNDHLEPGDHIKCNLDGMKFTAKVTNNSDSCFQWQGPPVYGLVAGLHSFYMEPANSGSSTVFKQTEEFSGILAFVMTPSLGAKKLKGQFEHFNKEIKACAEAAKGT